MATTAFTLPITRQVTLAQPDLPVPALRAQLGLTAAEDLILLHSGSERRLAEDDRIHLVPGDRLDCRPRHRVVVVTINGAAVPFETPHQTGGSIKAAAGIDPRDALTREGPGSVSVVIANDQAIDLEPCMTFISCPGGDYGAPEHDPPPDHYPAGAIPIRINGVPVTIDRPHLTGWELLALAGADTQDALAMDGPDGRSDVLAQDRTITLAPGMCFVTAPGGHYGAPALDLALLPGARVLPQPDGWTHVILPEVQIPEVYRPDRVEILVRLPPTFPDAAPDMFWIRPAVTLACGAAPQATTIEYLDGPWMRFSWHLQPGAWKPGRSTFADYVRFIRARFAQGT